MKNRNYFDHYGKRQIEVTGILNILAVVSLWFIYTRFPVATHLIFEQAFVEGSNPIFPILFFALFSLFLISLFFSARSFITPEWKIKKAEAFLTSKESITELTSESEFEISEEIERDNSFGTIVAKIKDRLGNFQQNMSGIDFHEWNQFGTTYTRINILICMHPIIWWSLVVSFQENVHPAWKLLSFVLAGIVFWLATIVEKENKDYLKGIKINPSINSKIQSIFSVLLLVVFAGLAFYFIYYEINAGPNTGKYMALSLILFFIFCIRYVLFYSKRLYDKWFKWVVSSRKGEANLLKSIRDLIYFTATSLLVVLVLNISKNGIAHNVAGDIDIDPNIVVHDFQDRFKKHINATKKGEPIYLITGQGGGSRAGLAFYSSLKQLDKSIGENIFAISTISGSSNGAAFFLSDKLNSDSRKMDENYVTDSSLYNVDYISRQLYGLLFLDRFLNLFSINNNKDRNSALIEKEKFAYKKRRLKTILDLSVYDNEVTNLPLFFPVAYNISEAKIGYYSKYNLNGDIDSIASNIKDVLPRDRALSYGRLVSLSEMFPLISASANIENRQFIDGGAYDNLSAEFMSELYKIIADMRDTIAPERQIKILSIENGNYSNTLQNINGNSIAPVSAAIQSIFNSNVTAHFSKMKLKAKRNGDKVYSLKIYEKDKSKGVEKGLLPGRFNMFKYTPDTIRPIVSRYLGAEEIKKIVNYSKTEVAKFNKEEIDNRKWEVYFDYANYGIKRGSIQDIKLENIMDIIKATKDSIFITGYSDKYGTEKSKEKIAKSRAEYVAARLKKGTDVKIGEVKFLPKEYEYNDLRQRYLDRKVTIEIK